MYALFFFFALQNHDHDRQGHAREEQESARLVRVPRVSQSVSRIGLRLLGVALTSARLLASMHAVTVSVQI